MGSHMLPSSGRNRFAPGWPLWLFTLGFLPVLISLGFWQLDRAEEKRSFDRQLSAAREQPSVPLASLESPTTAAWRAVTLQGYFDPQWIWLLDNRIRGGGRRGGSRAVVASGWQW